MMNGAGRGWKQGSAVCRKGGCVCSKTLVCVCVGVGPPSFSSLLRPPPPTHTVAPLPTPMQVYRILLRHSPVVQPLSVDEAYLDLTPLGFSGGVGGEGVGELVGTIRREIAETTGCTASAGVRVVWPAQVAVVDEDVGGLFGGRGPQLVGTIQREIAETTGYTASAGVGVEMREKQEGSTWLHILWS